MTELSNIQKRERRRARIRARIHGTATRPRLAVFKSNRNVSAQLIDDDAGVTLASASTLAGDAKGNRREAAEHIGGALAAKAAALGITTATFDRGGFRYIGIVSDVARGARNAGLTF